MRSPEGFGSVLTKNSNVLTFFSSFVVALATLFKHKFWNLSLGMASLMLSPKLFLLVIDNIFRLGQHKISVFFFLLPTLLAFAMFELSGWDWFYTYLVAGINNGMSIVLLICLIFFVESAMAKNDKTDIVARFILFCLPLLIWSRYTWAPIFGIYIVIFFLRFLLKEKSFQRVFWNRSDLILASISSFFVFLLLQNNSLFGFSPAALRFQESSVSNLLLFHIWYDGYHSFMNAVIGESFVRAIFFQLATHLLAGLGIFFLFENRLLAAGTFIGFWLIDILLFKVTPFPGGAFGWGEPMVSIFSLKRLFIIFAFMGWFVFLLRRKPFLSLSAQTQQMLLCFWPVTILLQSFAFLVWGKSATRYDLVRLPNTETLQLLKKKCQDGELEAVSWHGEYPFKGQLTEPRIVGSMMSAYVGCTTIGGNRYAEKLSYKDEWIAYRQQASYIYKFCSVPSEAVREKEMFRKEKLAVASFDGSCLFY